MVVVRQVVATGRGRHVQLVAGQPQTATRRSQRAHEVVVRIFHAIFGKRSLEATLVEGPIMRHERQIAYHRRYLRPHFRKRRLTVGVAARQAVHGRGEAAIIVGARLDKAVEAVDYAPFAHHNYADTAHAGAMTIGRLKIYGCKIFHLFII